jgi:hypothetical protein
MCDNIGVMKKITESLIDARRGRFLEVSAENSKSRLAVSSPGCKIKLKHKNSKQIL